MTIYWKMMLGFLVIILLMGAVDAYILLELNKVSNTTKSTITRDVRSVDLSKQLRATLFDEERYGQKYLISGDSTYFALFLDQSRLFEQLMDSLAHQPGDASMRRLVQDAERRHNWHFSLIQNARTAHGATGAGLGIRNTRARTDTLDLLYKNFDDLIHLKQMIVAASVVDVEQATERSANIALLLTIGTLLAATTLAFLLTRTITRPLKVLMRGTEQVARGSFEPIHVSTRGEVAQLADAFNTMSASLKQATAVRAEMMQHISHELRMPLQTMHAAYYLLTEEKAGPVTEGQVRLLHSIRDNIDKIARFSNQFLDLSKIEAGMMEYELVATDIPTVLAPVVDDAMVYAARKEIKMSLEMQPVPQARANPERCGQIFTNLLSNAVKYTPKGGTICVHVAPCSLGVRVSIKDSGVGIAAEELPHVFKKFYRAKSAHRGSGGGTGIGLALVKALAEGMGGCISATSTVGEGSEFSVEFARMDSAARGAS
jgi:two-component system, NtrC family, sensor histidine kinase GlrK